MFNVIKKLRGSRETKLDQKFAAVSKSHATIEFEIDGRILTANPQFLDTFGYSVEEIVGKHHSIFLEPEEAGSEEYRQFWASLKRGEFQSRQFKRVAKDGRRIWIQATYNPVVDKSGKPTSVIKLATVITDEVSHRAEVESKLTALSRSQAVIEFALDGTIVDANENFLAAMGYSIAEIKGRHHRMFVDDGYAASAEYKDFWARLAAGEPQVGEFQRIAKGGRDVWIVASYNPILDASGRPAKVLKFATDVTQQKLRTANFEGQINAIARSQAVIEFELDGTILTANQNFLAAMGYTLDEIRGKHHGMFVEAAYRRSDEYRAFWDDLAQGNFISSEFKRIAKGGREVWIQASYNPVMDPSGQPIKVVKFASDVTAQVVARMRAESVKNLMNDVAAASGQLDSSVREISVSMVRSKDTTADALSLVNKADAATKRLAESTEAVGGIIELIDGITGQINLLALNASIEAARAGDAGKGFAVVASEVKALARQAQASTERINGEISAVSSVSDEVVGTLNDIQKAFQQISEYVASTSAAVEEQAAVTGEMSANMNRAAAAAMQIGDAA